MKNAPPPAERRLWRLIWINFLAVLLAALVTTLHLGTGFLTPGAAQTVTCLALVVGWGAAMVFTLSETWARWLWIVWQGGGVLALLLKPQLGLALGLPLSGFFLTFRQYAAYRRISDRRRAAAFGLGLLAVGLLVLAWRYWDLTGPREGALGGLRYWGAWSLWSLLGFWLWSLFHLAVRMRLHFLRLRPKLAVSAVLIGVVPLVLVVSLGLVIFYTGLGGARAQRAGNILEGWRQVAAAGAELNAAPFDTTFAWPAPGADASILEKSAEDLGVTRVEPPAGLDELAASLAGAVRVDRAVGELDTVAPAARAAARADTTDYFVLDGNIWLIRWQDMDDETARARGWLLGQTPLEHLSSLLKAGVYLPAMGSAYNDDGSVDEKAEARELRHGFAARKVVYRDVSDDPAYWDKLRYFGVTIFPVVRLKGAVIEKSTVFLNLRVRWYDLRKEFLESEGRENINQAVVAVVAVLAGLFLILEVFALFFGIRISEGIVTAVHKLDRGTKELTAGNLDTTITLPNGDELGDLAESFNTMTAAIRQGREDALANERLTRELETAREIQERLLPSREPEVAGFEITGASIPTRQIGGDYFDFLIQEDGVVGVAIGDVSGKGMPAALLMSNLQASLHGQVIHPSPVNQVVQRVNNLIVGSTDPHMFATFFYGRLDIRSATFTSTNAGHNPPLVLRESGEFEELKMGGLLLGMVGGVDYKEQAITLAPGEVVVMYTDGITEAVGPSAEEDDPEAMFGEEALQEVILRSRHLPAVGIKEAILDAVAQHTSGVDQSDDITLVVIRRQG